MIAITFALRAESGDFIMQLGKPDNGLEVVVFHTGVGRKSAAAKIEDFLKNSKPRLLISSGFAGAAASELGVGTLILAENFSDPQVLMEAERALQKFSPKIGKLYSSDSIVDHPSERDKIARAQDALAIDMETGTIAAACQEREIPVLSLRVISDSAKQPFPAPRKVLFNLEKQRTDYAGLLAYLLRHPGAVPKLLRFSRQIRQAQDRLAHALNVLLKDEVFIAA